MKLYKIGVRFFLNKKVEQGIAPVDKKLSKYPIYVQVTYNRKNTQFRVELDFVTEEEFNASLDHIDLFEIRHTIEKVIEYEVLTKGDKFQLKGLGKRIEKYNSKLLNVLFSSVNKQLHASYLEYIKEVKSQGKKLSGKETFFLMGLYGNSEMIDLMEQARFSNPLSEYFKTIQDIGKFLLNDSCYRMTFDESIVKKLNSIIEFYNSNLNMEIFKAASVIDWLYSTWRSESSSMAGQINIIILLYLEE